MHERRFDGDISNLRSPERLARLEVDRVVDLCLQDAAIRSVLDVGTGSGIFAEAFARRGLSVAGVDVSPAMVAAAREHVPSAKFYTAPAELLPVGDRSYDLVFMGLVFHEVDDSLQALQEARRACRFRTAILEWPYQAQEFGPPLEHRMTVETVHGLAERAGFVPAQPLRLDHLVLYRFDC